MSLRQTLLSAAATALLAAPLSALAAPITPTSTTFGTLAGATFGGFGIPNTAVAITYAGNDVANAGQLTMGLTAHQRCIGPNLANNGAGVFTAFAGESQFLPGPGCGVGSPVGLATWNFGTYISGIDVSDLNFVLFYDFDPAAGNDESTHGTIAFSGTDISGVLPAQGSENLGFGYLATNAPAFGITAPGGSFNPNVGGEYSFALVAYMGQDEVARTAIVVNVRGDNTVPTPGTLALAGLALLGLAGLQRRRG
jgi:MYXO-CTERM domain-containing protein